MAKEQNGRRTHEELHYPTINGMLLGLTTTQQNHPLRKELRGPCKKQGLCWPDQLSAARTAATCRQSFTDIRLLLPRHVFLAWKGMSSRYNLYCTLLSLIQHTETATLISSRQLTLLSILRYDGISVIDKVNHSDYQPQSTILTPRRSQQCWTTLIIGSQGIFKAP